MSRQTVRWACYAGGALVLAAALGMERATLTGLWRPPEPDAPALPPVPDLSSGLPQGRSPAAYEPIHRLLGPPPAVASAPVERLPFQITGGFMELGPDARFVNIRNSAGKERVYRAGETIDADNAKILSVDVAAENVRVDWRGREWLLEWKRGGKPAAAGIPAVPAKTREPAEPPAASSAYEISGGQFQDYYDNFLGKYYQQGTYRMMPDGGLQIRDLQEGAEVRKYGFRPGDVVRSVNGESLSLSNISELFNASATRDEHVITGERGGKPFEVKITIKR